MPYWTNQSTMVSYEMTRLQNGEMFPALNVAAVGGGGIAISERLAGSYGVVLIYRGAWCPYCQAQLAGFQRAIERLSEAGIKVVALSVDDEETTRATIERHGLSFPVGHSADADERGGRYWGLHQCDASLPADDWISPDAQRQRR